MSEWTRRLAAISRAAALSRRLGSHEGYLLTTLELLTYIDDLAAEVRSLRIERDGAMSYFLDPNDPGSPPKYTADYGPSLLNQIQGLAGYYEEMMDEDRAEVERLKARVAELEPDARLGRMVREMPEGWEIYHSGAEDLSTKWSVHIWDAGEMDEYFGATPEEAIEKARQP